MSIVQKFAKKLFSKTEAKRPGIPSVVQTDVNPNELWEVINDLGEGSFGKIRRVVSRAEPRREAAEKCIDIQEGEELENLMIEVSILKACNHENIIRLYASYLYQEKIHMYLELCTGGSVEDIILELEKPIPEPAIAYISKYVNEALIYLHEMSVIHRDLKSSNILLTDDAQVKLADFGVSAKLRDVNDGRTTYIGTPYWMAPEVMVCENFKDSPYNTRSDMWSFGITMIEMAQMDPPYGDVKPERVAFRILKNDPPTLSNPKSWSLYFNDIIKRCLVKDASRRITAQELHTHPFLANAHDRRSVIALLAEKNAGIEQVEVIDDDTASVDDSVGESVEESVADSEDNHANISHEGSVRVDVGVDAQNGEVTFNDRTTEIPPSAPSAKKRAAPPPPTETPEHPHSPKSSTPKSARGTGVIQSPSNSSVSNRSPPLPSHRTSVSAKIVEELSIHEPSKEEPNAQKQVPDDETVDSQQDSNVDRNQTVENFDSEISLEAKMSKIGEASNTETSIPTSEFLNETTHVQVAAEVVETLPEMTPDGQQVDTVVVKEEHSVPSAEATAEKESFDLLEISQTVEALVAAIVDQFSDGESTDIVIPLPEEDSLTTSAIPATADLPTAKFTMENIPDNPPSDLPASGDVSSEVSPTNVDRPSLDSAERSQLHLATAVNVVTEQDERSSPSAMMSPRHEALNILEDLYSTLDDDQKHDQETRGTVVRVNHDSMQTPDEPEWHAPAPVYCVSPTPIEPTEIKVVQSPELNRVVQPGASRHSQPCASPVSSPRLVRPAYSLEGLDDKPLPSTQSETGSVGALRGKFEKQCRSAELSPTTTTGSERSSVEQIIPEGQVKNTIKQIISEQRAHAQPEPAIEKLMLSTELVQDPIKTTVSLKAPSVPIKANGSVSHSKTASSDSTGKSRSPKAVRPSTEQQLPIQTSLSASSASSDKVSSVSAAKTERRSPPEVRTKKQTNTVSATTSSSDPLSIDEYFAEDKREITMPPPEPPVDYDKKKTTVIQSKENIRPPTDMSSSVSSDKPMEQRTTLGARKNPSRQTVTRKTRRFMVDGVVCTSTTEHLLGRQQNLAQRRREMQELKRLQRIEARKLADQEKDTTSRVQDLLSQQSNEKKQLLSTYNAQLNDLLLRQKQQMLEADKMQEDEMVDLTKKLKKDKEKEMAHYRESLRQEVKILKQECDVLPRGQRKDAFRIRKENLEREHMMQEHNVADQLEQRVHRQLTAKHAAHREITKRLELDLIRERQDLMRQEDESKRRLEENHMVQMANLRMTTIRERFMLLRHQMITRHTSELENLSKMQTQERDELQKALATDSKRLPKLLSAQSKARVMMFKESLRINGSADSKDGQEQMRQFNDRERQRRDEALADHTKKSARKLEELNARHELEKAELLEAQNSTKKLLLERQQQSESEFSLKANKAAEEFSQERDQMKEEREHSFQQDLYLVDVFYSNPQGNISSAPILSGRHRLVN